MIPKIVITIGQQEFILGPSLSLSDLPAHFGESLRQELTEGPIRGLNLFSQTFMVLHGSCVTLSGSSVSLVGSSGAGKSTLAAKLCQQGAKLVSDGMTPVHPVSLEVPPGPSRSKLNDESIRLLGENPSSFELIYPEATKRYFPVNGIASAPRLNLILIVEDAEETAITPMSGADAVMKLIAYAYLGSYLPPEHSQVLLERAAALIQHGVQVKYLRRKKEPDRLLETVEAIEREVAQLS